MDDLELTKRCALHDDAQAMALVKRHKLSMYWDHEDGVWCVAPGLTGHDISNTDLNRAIVECVAKVDAKCSAGHTDSATVK